MKRQYSRLKKAGMTEQEVNNIQPLDQFLYFSDLTQSTLKSWCVENYGNGYIRLQLYLPKSKDTTDIMLTVEQAMNSLTPTGQSGYIDKYTEGLV